MTSPASPPMASRPFDYRLPRLYIQTALGADQLVTLTDQAHHYIARVLRRQIGDDIIVFNGEDGEWIAKITDLHKKSLDITLMLCRRPQPDTSPAPSLIFAPLKKAPMDFLVEKSVELGIATLQPVLTDHSMTKRLNQDRLQAQIIEAVEQCERLTMPDLLPILSLDQFLHQFPENKIIWWAAEAGSAPAFPDAINNFMTENKQNPIDLAESAILIGPEGGFSETENTHLLQHPQIRPISLGAGLLRAETAALAAISCLQAMRGAWQLRPDFRSISAQ